MPASKTAEKKQEPARASWGRKAIAGLRGATGALSKVGGMPSLPTTLPALPAIDVSSLQVPELPDVASLDLSAMPGMDEMKGAMQDAGKLAQSAMRKASELEVRELKDDEADEPDAKDKLSPAREAIATGAPARIQIFCCSSAGQP